MADEIEIVDYDPRWPGLYETEAQSLRALVPSGLLLRIEHVGSTAVPRLAAKPVIDIMALVSSLAEARAIGVAPLERGGYALWADSLDSERIFFVRGLPPAAARRTHHLHLTESPAILARHLAFRDALRADPEEARRYARLKLDLASSFRRDRDGYTAAKAAHIAAVLARCGG